MTAPAAGRVSAVIATRDSAERLECALSGLARTAWPDLEVIVVDNGSSCRRTLDVLARSGATVIARDVEFNHSRLMNAGAAAATGEFLLLLNDDIEVLDPSWVARLVRAASRPRVGPVGALLLYPDGTIQHCGVAVRDGAPWHPHAGARLDAAGREWVGGVARRWAVTGACMLVRTVLFHELGGMDPLLRTGYNDIDLCLRARRRGHETVLHAGVRLIHHESATRGTDATPATAADWLMFRTRWAEELGLSGPVAATAA